MEMEKLSRDGSMFVICRRDPKDHDDTFTIFYQQHLFDPATSITLTWDHLNALMNLAQNGLCPSCNQPLPNIHDVVCDDCFEMAKANREALCVD
jgi:hypothetical protein